MPINTQQRKSVTKKLDISPPVLRARGSPPGGGHVSKAEILTRMLENNAARYAYDVDGNIVGLIDQNDNAVPTTSSVDSWTQLQNIPTANADNLILFETDVPEEKSLFVYKPGDALWKSLNGPPAVANSIMWLGDSLTAATSGSVNPNMTPRLPYFYGSAITYTNLNYLGTWISGTRAGYACATSGNGTLTYTRSTRTLTWTAPGDSAGTPVDVSKGGWVRLESASANMELCLTLVVENEPLLDKTDTFGFSGLTANVTQAYINTCAGSWLAQNGNPFGERQYFFAGSSFTTNGFIQAIDQWKDIKTDITVIDLGTNDIKTDIATCDAALANLQTIIKRRKAIGSRCVVSLINLNNFASDTNTKLIGYYNAKVLAMSRTLEFETYDGNPWISNPAGTLATPGRTSCFAVDTLHLSQEGAYLKAKYALDPVLKKFYAKQATLRNPIISYDATYAPSGNLLLNGQLLGTAGTKSARCTGDIASNWTCTPSGGSVLAVVGTMPQSASPIARTDGRPGFWAKFAIDNTAGVANEYMNLFQSAFISSSNYAAGDTLVLSGEFMISGSGISGINIFFVSAGSGQCYAVQRQSNTDMGSLNSETGVFQFESLPMTLLSGATNLQCNVQVLMAAGGVCNFYLGQSMHLRKVS